MKSEIGKKRLKEIIDFEMVLNKEIIQEIKKLVKTYNYTCYYTDKHVDFMDDLEVILDKYKEENKAKTLERLDNTYKLCELFLKQYNRKYPEKMYYIKLLKEFCKNKQKYYFNKYLFGVE